MDPRNYKIEGAELNWAKLSKPVQNPFNKEEYQYELQIATTDAEVAKEWAANHLNVKTDKKTGKFVVSLRRKAKKANGEDNGPVRVVDGNLAPFDKVNSIGNGSIGNVIVFQYEWSNMGRTGISSSLTAVQITQYEEYTPENAVDFSVVGGGEEPQENADPVSMF